MKNAFRWGVMFLLPIIALMALGATQEAHAAAQHFSQIGSGVLIAGTLLGATLPTLVDITKRLDPDGGIAQVGELLSLENQIINDIGWKEGNLPTGHQYTQRVGLPDVYYRQLNAGVPNSKSQTAQVTEQAAILEARSQVDADLAMLNGNTAAWRLSEVQPFLEAMAQKFATTLFYGNAGTDPEQFSGLSTRYSSLTAGNGGNIVDAGGTGADNASIWFANPNSPSLHGIYPKGSVAGLQHKDLGEQDAFDGSNNRFRALLDWFQWKHGIALVDWRNTVRIANIDISNMVAQSGQAVLTTQMIKAVHRIKKLQGTKIYMNRSIIQYLELEQRAAVSVGGQLKYEVVDGVPVTTFRGLPIRLVDALLETEARVT